MEPPPGPPVEVEFLRESEAALKDGDRKLAKSKLAEAISNGSAAAALNLADLCQEDGEEGEAVLAYLRACSVISDYRANHVFMSYCLDNAIISMGTLDQAEYQWADSLLGKISNEATDVVLLVLSQIARGLLSDNKLSKCSDSENRELYQNEAISYYRAAIGCGLAIRGAKGADEDKVVTFLRNEAIERLDLVQNRLKALAGVGLPSKPYCAQCGAENVKLLRCSRCKAVYYCGLPCQKTHLKTHRDLCKRLAQGLK
eukprot:Rmarinus@m.4254